ncbi:MAG TPA: hypothetical protein VFW93_08580 [Aquabacterium sp.]|uniref:hypothetical protein n=1 Tax=Aquabacterium sp. TaxID=1872578 RepID=UPI002E35BD2B|nr:hypothetical protein [Aquabacterium sp.]HEX5356261.1 hypothetical protein [Aquabacterium sp.]
MATDWSGRKYRVLKSLGENIDMIFGVYQPSSDRMQWFLHSHEVDDGGGAIVKILASLGISMPPKAHKSIPPKPGFFGRLAALKLHLRNSRPVNYPWRKAEATAPSSPAEHCFVYYLTSLAHSDQLRACARSQGVGETSLFLASLDKVCRERFLQEDCERVWMMPHDFRRSLGIQTQSGNWTAPVSLRLRGAPSTQDIYGQLKSLYGKGILWGSWIYTNFARWLSDDMIRRAYNRLRHRAWFGVYANMSAWQAPPADAHKLAGSWVVSAPPLSAVCPITTGSFTWEGRTGFTMQLHPSLNADRQAAMDLMRAWMADLHRVADITESDIQPRSIAMHDLQQQARRVDA